MEELFLPTDLFGYLEDGHIDVWFKKDPLFTSKVQNEFLGAIEDAGYTYDLVRRKDAELKIKEVDEVDAAKPNVQGRVIFKEGGDEAVVKVNLRPQVTKGWRRFNTFLAHHEMGHALGLEHQFGRSITDTVMNYPTFDEIYSGRAAKRLTNADLFNAHNFYDIITNVKVPLLP